MGDYYSRVSGWGMYVPDRVLTNHELAEMVDTSDEWIRSRTGIRERRIAADEQAVTDLAVRAALPALEQAGITAADLDMIIVATSTPDYVCPPVSSMVQDRLGANKAGAMTLVAGCSGFVYGMVSAAQFVENGVYEHVLVIGAEKLSYAVDWEDRSTNILFGDGAGAVVVSRSRQPGGLQSVKLGSDGSGWDALIVPAYGSAIPMTPEALERKEHKLRMNGVRVFKFATRVMTDAVTAVVSDAGLIMSDIDVLIPHQANERIIELALRRLNFERDKTIVNLDRYGNTSAASIPLALCEGLADGRIQRGDNIVMVAFGAGLTYAACVWNWQPEEAGEEPILVSDWPVPESFQQAAQTMRTTAWRWQVQARTKASDAALAVMLPLYSFRKGVKKRLKR